MAQIEGLWEDVYGEIMLTCRWAYYPEETSAGRVRGQHARELVHTDHTDTNTVDTIGGRARVVSEAEFREFEARWCAAADDASSASASAGVGASSSSSSSSAASSAGTRWAADGDPARPWWEVFAEREGCELFFVRTFYDYRTKQFRPLLRGRAEGGGGVSGGFGAAIGVDGVQERVASSTAASSSAGAQAQLAARTRGKAPSALTLGSGGVKVDEGGAAAAALAKAVARGRTAPPPASAAAAAGGKGASSSSAPYSSLSASSAAVAGSSSGGAGGARRLTFTELCREAQAKLQLSAVPPTLPCRDSERTQVTDFIRSHVSKGGLGGTLYISGMPGTGKTATVRGVVRDLLAETEAGAPGALPPFDFHEINAMRLASPYQAYSALYTAATGGLHAAPKRAAELLDAHFNKPAPGKR